MELCQTIEEDETDVVSVLGIEDGTDGYDFCNSMGIYLLGISPSLPDSWRMGLFKNDIKCHTAKVKKWESECPWLKMFFSLYTSWVKDYDPSPRLL